MASVIGTLYNMIYLLKNFVARRAGAVSLIKFACDEKALPANVRFPPFRSR